MRAVLALSRRWIQPRGASLGSLLSRVLSTDHNSNVCGKRWDDVVLSLWRWPYHAAPMEAQGCDDTEVFRKEKVVSVIQISILKFLFWKFSPREVGKRQRQREGKARKMPTAVLFIIGINKSNLNACLSVSICSVEHYAIIKHDRF